MNDGPNQYTKKVIYWINEHQYSKDHWDLVAAEILKESQQDMDEAIKRLAFAIRNFHLKFQDAVVKPGNVLYDIIDLAFININWDSVAKSVYDAIEKDKDKTQD